MRSCMLEDTSVLPMAASLAPVARTAEQVRRGGGEVVVGVEQPDRGRDHAEAIGVGIVAEGQVEVGAQLDEPGHGVRRRRIHADLAVPVDAS